MFMCCLLCISPLSPLMNDRHVLSYRYPMHLVKMPHDCHVEFGWITIFLWFSYGCPTVFRAVSMTSPPGQTTMALSSQLNDKSLARFRTKPCERLVAAGAIPGYSDRDL